MDKKSNRYQQLNQVLQKDIATILQSDIRDPRVSGSMITVSSVELSSNLVHAKVYITLLHPLKNQDSEKKIQDILKVLNGASGYIRTLLGKIRPLRVLPALNFFYDESLVGGIHMSKLISRILG